MKSVKISKKTVIKVIWVIYASLSILIWLPQADRLFSKDYAKISSHLSLDDSWRIRIGDDTFSNVSLDDFRFPAVNKGDEIYMQRKLPSDWDITEAAMRLHIRQSAVRIYIDNKRVYEYGYDRMSVNKTVGSGVQFINFPDAYKGKTLTIHLYLTEDKAFTSFDSIRLYEWENAYRALMTENRIPVYLGWFLLVFGIITSIITIFAITFSIKYVRLLCISVFSLCMGFWTLCYYNVILIFSIPLYSVSMLEYLTLYLSPISLTVYMHEEVKTLKHKGIKAFYWVFLTVQLVTITVMITLHTFDAVHLAAGLWFMQLVIVVSLIGFFTVLLMNLKYNRMADRLYLIGMLVIGGCITYDLISYVGNRYYGGAALPLKGVTSMGVMVFVFILIASFYKNLTDKLMQEAEQNSLIKRAYTDELTQLYNRRYCMEYIDKLKEEGILDYTVVCFDLNNLKTMNDTYGHAKGDILIKSAAEVIAETFEEHGIVARMGGDEFIAVLRTSDPKEIDALKEDFTTNLQKKNQEIKDLNMSIACGYASSSEKNDEIEKIYQMADDRMYENKKQMKRQALHVHNITV